METNPLESLTAPANYDLFVFGDSLSDTGHIFRLSGGLFPPPPYFNGRFSNGAVAVESLATSLGLGYQTTNFALGGARSGRTNLFDNPAFQVGGLLDQIDRFKAQAIPLGAGAEDLYFIWVGANDFLDSSNPDTTATLNTAVANIATAVTTLAQSGAKNIVVVQTPNLGRTPLAVEQGLLQPLTQVSLAFNAALASTLTPLEASLGGANIILADLFAIAENIAQNPASFGFTDVTTPYVSTVFPQNPTADPSPFFFWDRTHPTTRGHALFANVLRRDVIAGITDNVVRIGTAAAERLVGFSGNDRLRGLAGADVLEGNAGRDALLGGAGTDVIVGGGGNDQLTGGEGQDTLRGGLGADRFIYTAVGDRSDVIGDFQSGRDLIDLRVAFNQPTYAQGDRFAAYVRVTQLGSDTIVRFDTNGDTLGGFATLARLSNVVAGTLNASSFLLG
ncbi:MAG: SGNH/GDSL hydrolase family protein [Oculatellaceae cyanobacterium bins.114]|nr:SGNH/GDSL hydrolase family protein [Oculatellaceae cyanobacterium bins.114]